MFAFTHFIQGPNCSGNILEYLTLYPTSSGSLQCSKSSYMQISSCMCVNMSVVCLLHSTIDQNYSVYAMIA